MDNNTDTGNSTNAPNGDDIPTYTVAQYIRQRWEELPEEEKQMWRDKETQGVSESDSSPIEGLVSSSCLPCALVLIIFIVPRAE